MAESKILLEHQEALLNMRSRAARLSYALEHFSDTGKAPNVTFEKSHCTVGTTVRPNYDTVSCQ